VYLLTKLATYVEIAAAAPALEYERHKENKKMIASTIGNVHCHFDCKHPAKEFILHVEWLFYQRQSSRKHSPGSSHSPAVFTLPLDAFIESYAKRPFPAPVGEPNYGVRSLDECRVISTPNLRIRWDDEIAYDVVVFEIEATRRLHRQRIQVGALLFFPADGTWAGGDEKGAFSLTIDHPEKYRCHDPPYLFDGSNGRMLDSDGNQIQFVDFE
jgi:hypothetical protein